MTLYPSLRIDVPKGDEWLYEKYSKAKPDSDQIAGKEGFFSGKETLSTKCPPKLEVESEEEEGEEIFPGVVSDVF